MYKDFYDIFKKSLDIDTANYVPLSSAALAVRNAVLALAPQGTITLENMENFRIFNSGIPNVKSVFVFVDMRSIEDEQMHVYYTTNINNKRYAILYCKFDKLGDTEYFIKVIYCTIYHIIRLLNDSAIDFTDIFNEEYGEKISKAAIQNKSGLIQVSTDVFVAYVISYYVLEIGSAISYEDFMNVFLDHIDRDNPILSDIIYRIADFCRNYTIEQMLDEGLVALAVRSAVYGEDN